MSGEVWAIVLAAGSGARFGGHKQFVRIGGVRLVDRVVATATQACDHVVVVLPPDEPWEGPPVTAAVAGGDTRSESVRAGLAVVALDAGVVVIHDAAHPLADAELFGRVIERVRAGAGAAVPVLRFNETIKRVDAEGAVVESVDRTELVQVQTPHAYDADLLRRAHAAGGEATDDSVLVEALGATVWTVPGSPINLHVTTPEELALAERMAAPPAEGQSSQTRQGA